MPDSSSGEEGLVGVWKETGPKVAHYDAQGILIDSVDINATFQFNEDFSYVAQNTYYLGGENGAWTFDTITNTIYLIPVVSQPTANSDHVWSVQRLDAVDLWVNHVYKVNLPEESYTVSAQRNFKRVY